MRRWLIIVLSFLSLLVAGCATNTPVVRSEVTAFHEWPADLKGSTFTFAPAPEQQNSLEYRAYQSLIKEELEEQGLRYVDDPQLAHLKVRFNYGIAGRDMRIVEPVVIDPVYTPFYRPRWGYGYGPFYDPFWYGSPYVERRENQFVLYTRQLNVDIARGADGKPLYETRVISEGRDRSLAAIMPYLVESAFAEFPGKSGATRRVELKRGQ